MAWNLLRIRENFLVANWHNQRLRLLTHNSQMCRMGNIALPERPTCTLVISVHRYCEADNQQSSTAGPGRRRRRSPLTHQSLIGMPSLTDHSLSWTSESPYCLLLYITQKYFFSVVEERMSTRTRCIKSTTTHSPLNQQAHKINRIP